MADDQAGALYCYHRAGPAPVRQRLASIGHEAERGTLKYRCPARHEGWERPSDTVCNGERKLGLMLRVKQEIDLRRFPSMPRALRELLNESAEPAAAPAAAHE